jgi:iduronate 2-sulfatase
MVESIDIFPTIVELVGLPNIPTCKGVDQPPTTLCLQGESYANEFVGGGEGAIQAPPSKQYAFSQWPFPAWGNETSMLREGYTVRSASGYRYTTYVPYNVTSFAGDWDAMVGDEELYDYNRDRYSTRLETEFCARLNRIVCLLVNRILHFVNTVYWDSRCCVTSSVR